MESFFDLARERYSLRRFSDREVTEEDLRHVLEVGRLAPTGKNAQPQRILVLKGVQEMELLSTCTPYVFGAPAALVVAYDPRVSWCSADGRNVGQIDASLVACHMVLAAQEIGLGSLIVADFDEHALRDAFEIPDAYEVCLIICLGYASEGAHPTFRLHDVRLPLEATVSYGSFSKSQDEPASASVFDAVLQTKTDTIQDGELC